MTCIRLTVGATVLTGRLDDTPAAAELAVLLPLDLNLRDFHGIEKIADLPHRLDTSATPASYQPQAGDITLYAPWGNLAIFLAPHRDSPGLVRLGRLDGPVATLPDGPVRIERMETIHTKEGTQT